MPANVTALPTSRTNPVGGTVRLRETNKTIWQGLRKVRRWFIERVEAIPTERTSVGVNMGRYAINADSYDYLIDLQELEAIVRELEQRMNGANPPDYMAEQAVAAYTQGTGTAVTALAALTDDYTRTITGVLSSDPWLRRVALIRSRVFEEMKGFNADTVQDLRRVLSDAVENGLSPLDLVDTISKRFDVSRSRAERIARTEITGALRRARLDETEDARQRLGIPVAMLWISALRVSTRRWHAARHGLTYTPQEVREFYSQGAEAINCLCSQAQALVDEDGNLLNQEVPARMRRVKKEWEDSEGLS